MFPEHALGFRTFREVLENQAGNSVFTNAWTRGLEFVAAEHDHLGGSGRSPRSQAAGQSPLPQHGLIGGCRACHPPGREEKGWPERMATAIRGRNVVAQLPAPGQGRLFFPPSSAYRESGALPRRAAPVHATVPLVPGLMCQGRSKAKPARTPSRLPFPYPGFPPFVPTPRRGAEGLEEEEEKRQQRRGHRLPPSSSRLALRAEPG